MPTAPEASLTICTIPLAETSPSTDPDVVEMTGTEPSMRAIRSDRPDTEL